MNNRFYILLILILICPFIIDAHTHDQEEGSITDGAVEMVDTYPNQFVSGTLPVLYIYTENGKNITSKEVYINATYFVDIVIVIVKHSSDNVKLHKLQHHWI